MSASSTKWSGANSNTADNLDKIIFLTIKKKGAHLL